MNEKIYMRLVVPGSSKSRNLLIDVLQVTNKTNFNSLDFTTLKILEIKIVYFYFAKLFLIFCLCLHELHYYLQF